MTKIKNLSKVHYIFRNETIMEVVRLGQYDSIMANEFKACMTPRYVMN